MGSSAEPSFFPPRKGPLVSCSSSASSSSSSCSSDADARPFVACLAPFTTPFGDTSWFFGLVDALLFVFPSCLFRRPGLGVPGVVAALLDLCLLLIPVGLSLEEYNAGWSTPCPERVRLRVTGLTLLGKSRVGIEFKPICVIEGLVGSS